MRTATDKVEDFLTRLCCLIPRPTVPAERYLAIGDVVCFGLRQGFAIKDIARGLRIPISECLLAREFAESSTRLKFRALVEKWSWGQIVTAMTCDQVFDNGDWSPLNASSRDPVLRTRMLSGRRRRSPFRH